MYGEEEARGTQASALVVHVRAQGGSAQVERYVAPIDAVDRLTGHQWEQTQGGRASSSSSGNGNSGSRSGGQAQGPLEKNELCDAESSSGRIACRSRKGMENAPAVRLESALRAPFHALAWVWLGHESRAGKDGCTNFSVVVCAQMCTPTDDTTPPSGSRPAPNHGSK
eukprot:CAMPEP_0118964458 /NCGR_PEP_ID=MMETSP1173-20130426/2136_1 /TAXON_ID=1034831 /ORGANISM="Rhizochromulina marina cf, Strain CCMP1243" /LENGTH=167 /DNA_ID=CAMNT_0006912913 /DNA_START=513 /DNA_END=1015 /DNA_ORIENTATION=+